MMTKINLDRNIPASVAAATELCAATLHRPGAVALVPTETVYGLVCRWDDRTAVERIYQLKDRSESKPLALFVATPEQLATLGIALPENARKLA
ncbi:MAG: Sua5/YciO/YrdC/YwlC family protein, partial [Victivallales bacterium]|nr:Sua5/YciO/YrdC/YwlC family protein [Victivallales bacterium]